MSKKIMCGLVILWLITMFVVSSCAKIERIESNGEKTYLYIVGRDDANGVVCYGNINSADAISCIKVR